MFAFINNVQPKPEVNLVDVSPPEQRQTSLLMDLRTNGPAFRASQHLLVAHSTMSPWRM